MKLSIYIKAMDTTKKIQEELFQSIMQHKVERVKEILSDYPGLADAEHLLDFHLGPCTPLMVACYCGEFTIILCSTRLIESRRFCWIIQN